MTIQGPRPSFVERIPPLAPVGYPWGYRGLPGTQGQCRKCGVESELATCWAPGQPWWLSRLIERFLFRPWERCCSDCPGREHLHRHCYWCGATWIDETEDTKRLFETVV